MLGLILEFWPFVRLASGGIGCIHEPGDGGLCVGLLIFSHWLRVIRLTMAVRGTPTPNQPTNPDIPKPLCVSGAR